MSDQHLHRTTFVSLGRSGRSQSAPQIGSTYIDCPFNVLSTQTCTRQESSVQPEVGHRLVAFVLLRSSSSLLGEGSMPLPSMVLHVQDCGTLQKSEVATHLDICWRVDPPRRNADQTTFCPNVYEETCYLSNSVPERPLSRKFRGRPVTETAQCCDHKGSRCRRNPSKREADDHERTIDVDSSPTNFPWA